MKVACSWGGTSAYVTDPVDFPAKNFWNWILTGNPDNSAGFDMPYVGSLGVGTDSALLSTTLTAGDRGYYAMAKTATAAYIVVIISYKSLDADVPDAYYSQAIAMMLQHMIDKHPGVAPNPVPAGSGPTCEEARPIFGHFDATADAAWTAFAQKYFGGSEQDADNWAAGECGLSYE